MGHPIIGDRKYGGPDAIGGGEMSPLMHLHARSIELPHPAKGTIRAQADLPAHMRATWDLLAFDEEDAVGVFDQLDGGS
jgi:23S rRNA pseudouridine955/2504/2580 synthase